MADTDAIRYRPDGSIDTRFYMDRARHLRSRQAHDLLTLSRSEKRKSPAFLQRIFGGSAFG